MVVWRLLCDFRAGKQTQAKIANDELRIINSIEA